MVRRKIFNDPVHGFISIPDGLLFNLVEHPWFQRLRRIKQLGLTHLVYPGALHTRFHHTLGAMHLMEEAIDVLRSKGHVITPEEAGAAAAAILLHDIGHGPFSHALEHSIVSDVPHEALSEVFMRRLNEQFNGDLDLAISIFNGSYHKRFLHQLVSGQLDVDRLDYLKRDSYFTGVIEGSIGTDRIIKMLEVDGDELVLEAKALYSIENFLVARRLMYWQVYLHKTVLSAEYLLVNILARAREMVTEGNELFATPSLQLFLKENFTRSGFNQRPELIESFALLDDFDIFSAIKVWSTHSDYVLRQLSGQLVNRRLFKIVMQEEPFGEAIIEKAGKEAIERGIPADAVNYFVFTGAVENRAYDPSFSSIRLMDRNGATRDVTEASGRLGLQYLSESTRKFFLCSMKQ
ncbi:MAG TPA: phosphohydrolase [Bacteroidales bacterium]|nr:MAG: phosphohydrolase [Bacteroidetes bacterium GWE2_42_24]OFY32762.1 MAG: phosphohydrolase [Bacteroidetes bacterium GWF2_43_11]PKP24484.1 MAG: phosphohydrolase [Bacteroidetes bacterium HGW-Bacteroidetes-22]HBZ65198.1 phosphohydrolase [Bacteroidales bacterium]